MEEDASLWLAKAKESLEDAHASFAAHRYGLTAFSCQQTLEKLLKATVIIRKGVRPRKIHDLLPLLRDSGISLPDEFTMEIAKISKFYFLVRYPDINKQFFTTPDMAKNALEKTQEVFLWIEKSFNQS